MALKEKPKRLAPTKETLRQLFAFSGNLCAHPGCPNVLINPKGKFIGQVCHIEAAETGGPRFNPNMTNEERRQPSNLMLMCHQHHVETDDLKDFPVYRLQEMKQAHEWRFVNPAQAIASTLTDWDQTNLLVAPQNLRRFTAVRNHKISNEKEERAFISSMQEAIQRLAQTPFKARDAFSLICQKIAEQHRRGHFSRHFDPDKLSEAIFRQGLNLTPDEVMEFGLILKAYELGSFEYEDLLPHERYLQAYDVDDYPFFIELAQFANDVGIDPDTYFINLKFSSLDAEGAL